MGPLDFFATAFGDGVSASHKLVLWESATKKSYWHDSLPEAAARALEISARADCYFGCLLQDAAAEIGGSRGRASSTRVLGGIWLDIDMAGPHHQAPGLPTDEAAVWKLLSGLPLPASLVLRTGGGFHAWWMLREPYQIETDAERDAIVAPTVHGWQALCRERAGFTLDATHDLARVMRIPCTRNHKYGVDVALASAPGKRPLYNISDFEQWRSAPQRARTAAPVRVLVNHAAVVPDAKIAALIEWDTRFAATWNRQRPEFKSQSEYDYSLASSAIHFGFTDQETVDLLVAHRRMANPEDPKIERPGYFEATIGKLRAEKTRVVETSVAAERIQEAAKAPETQAVRSGILSDLSAMLGFQVDKLIKFNCDPPIYRLETPKGKIQLGGVDALLTFGRFRAKVAAATGEIMPRPARGQWEPMSKALLAAVEVQDLGDASEDGGGARAWLREYVNSIDKLSATRGESAKSRSPWVEHGHIWFFVEQLRVFLVIRGVRLPFNELAIRLRSAGARPRTVAAKREDGGATTVRVWGIDVDVVGVQVYNTLERE